MLQRIQTVYLVIAFIAISLLFSRLPIAEFTLINVGNIPLNVISSYQNPDLSQDVYTNINVLPLMITIAVLLILIIASIILYGNRPLQLKITMFAFLLNVVLIIVMFFTSDNMQNQLNTQANYKFGAILPLISLVLIILASKAIRKDERLVKGSDRLR
jgi:glucan phosphoethanolaminetransferase (alkaline phosphatase superfamily)